jgi:type II secretory pathway component PulF
MAEIAPPTPFAYQAQTATGDLLTGTIDAPSIGDATRQLQSLGLSLTRLEPAEKKSPTRADPFRAADFLAFNQQLAALTGGGMPIERGLRLMAAELDDKRQTAVLDRIAGRLEKGTPLADAFGAEKTAFPPLYAGLLEAGVRTNNLPGMLLNLGRHAQLLQRLRAAWWKSASYPLMVLVTLLLVMVFIWIVVLPQFAAASAGPIFEWGGPMPTGRTGGDPNVALALAGANVIGCVIMVGISLVLIGVLTLSIMSRTNAGRATASKWALRVPLVGPVMKWSLIARWCDAVHLCVQAGMSLPASLELARNAVPSSKLQADTQSMIDAVNAGRSLETGSKTTLIPPLVPASLQMGIEKNDLPGTAAMLTQMYQEQAEIRLAVLPRVLSPMLLTLTAVSIGLAVLSMMLPMIAMIQSISGPLFK